MNKKLLIVILVMLCVVPISYAALGDNIVHWYTFEEAAGDLLDQVGTQDGNNTGAVTYQRTGVEGFAYNYTSNAFTDLNDIDWGESFTVSGWINAPPSSADGSIIWDDDIGAFRVYRLYVRNTDGQVSTRVWRNGGATNCEIESVGPNAYNATIWHHIATTYNDTDDTFKLYIDGKFIASDTCAGPQHNGNKGVLIGKASAQYLRGGIDNVGIWERALGPAEILQLNATVSPIVVPITYAISIDFQKPLNNTQHNTLSLDINYTVNDTICNCTLYRNGIGNGTQTAVVKDVVNTFTDTFTSTTETQINYSINCVVANQSTSTASTVNHSIYVDTVNPTITTTFNNTVLLNGTGNITGTFALSDTYLFSYNVSLDGVHIDSGTDLGVPIFNYNLSEVPTGELGTHNLTFTIRDGHTTKTIDYYKTIIYDKELKYEFGNKQISIYPKYKSKYETVKTTKKIDRYSFEFKMKDSATLTSYETYYVESDNEIIVPKNSKFPGHVIDMTAGKWIDFSTEDNNVVETRQINKNKIEVKVYNPKRKMVFNSIGDLNEVNISYSWFLVDATATTPLSVFEAQTVQFNLTVDTGTATVDNVTGLFIFNKTQHFNITGTTVGNITILVSEINFSLQTPLNITIPTQWNFTVTKDGTATTDTLTEVNITSFQMFFGNCTILANTTTLYINIRGEKVDKPVIASVSGTYAVAITSNTTAEREFTFPLAGASTYRLCINPHFAKYYIDGTLTYSATDYNPRTSFFTDTLFTNVSQNISLLLINTSYVEQILLQVTDEFGQGLEGYFIQSLKFDEDNNSFSLVETSKTDYRGETSALLEINDVFYKFNILDPDSNLIRVIPSLKIFRSNYIFQIRLQDEFADVFLRTQDVSHSLRWDNVSQTFTLTYSSPANTLDEMCLKVVRQTAFRSDVVCKNCLTTDAGAINCFVNTTTEGLYIAQAIMDTTSPLSNQLVDQISIVVGSVRSKMKVGNIGLFVLMVLLMSLTFMVSRSAAATVASGLLITIIGVFFGMVEWQLGALMSLVAIGIWLMYKMNN